MNIPKHYLWLCMVILISCATSSCKKQDLQTTSLGSVFPLTAGAGDTLTISGTKLTLNGATPVIKLNDQPMTIIKSGPDELQVIVPKLAGSGKIMATVGNKTYTGPDFTYKYKATVGRGLNLHGGSV